VRNIIVSVGICARNSITRKHDSISLLIFLGLRRIEWVILGVEDSTNLGIARGFCILAGLYLASMMDGTSIETPSAAVGYVFVSGFSAGADSTRDFR
jgi:hypothetical protein